MRGAALVLVFLASGCDTGSAASPTFETTPATAEGGGGVVEAGFAVCPPDIDASFGSIYTQMLSTSSCGSASSSCHSTLGSSPAGTGNGLDYSQDAGAVYAELLGPDGGGQLAHNIQGTTSVLRVVPFDAGASMLYIKLTTTSATGPYGSGMPDTAPGSVCPATLEAVAAWINAGAPLVPPDAGPVVDAAGDADAGAGADSAGD
ncbi:MAG TPA: hypothetical protein VGL81_24935 [Polyangiaceae bacterium]|jgi:hypothetical protein